MVFFGWKQQCPSRGPRSARRSCRWRQMFIIWYKLSIVYIQYIYIYIKTLKSISVQNIYIYIVTYALANPEDLAAFRRHDAQKASCKYGIIGGDYCFEQIPHLWVKTDSLTESSNFQRILHTWMTFLFYLEKNPSEEIQRKLQEECFLKEIPCILNECAVFLQGQLILESGINSLLKKDTILFCWNDTFFVEMKKCSIKPICEVKRFCVERKAPFSKRLYINCWDAVAYTGLNPTISHTHHISPRLL